MVMESDPGLRVAFRPLAHADLEAMSRWLADPEVARWWREEDTGLDAVREKYIPVIDGSDPVRGFVIVIEGEDAGYIQAYRLADHPGYARQIPFDPAAVATDLFIGEPGRRGRGWGARVLRAFLDAIVFGEYAAGLAMIAPEPSNARAIRVYERVGFRWVATVPVLDEESPLDAGDEYVMVLSRREWEADPSGQGSL